IRLLADPQAPIDARLLALGAVQNFWNDDVRRALIVALRDPNPDLVRLAADGLSLNSTMLDPEATAALVEQLDSFSPAVRRSVVLALGRIGTPGVEDFLINVYKNDTGGDVYLTDAIVRALERRRESGMHKFIELAESGVEKHL